MKNEAPARDLLRRYFRQKGIMEFPFLSIGRQGFRSAVEVLADAAAREGKYVNVGAHLSGARSMGVNVITFRFADTAEIPTGFYPIYPNGLFVAHESFLSRGSLWQYAPGISHSLNAFSSGILMVCTRKSPEEIEYPSDFEGTVATVDAETIFSEKIAIQPAPYAITALGLFVRATDNLIGLDAVKQSILEFERLGKTMRELNAETMVKAYEETKVLRDVKIKEASTTAATGVGTAGGRALLGGFAWKDKLPICDQTKCKCIECLAAYYCPEGAISWKDEVYHVDYDFCKGCGTCAQECTEDAIKMGDAAKVLSGPSK